MKRLLIFITVMLIGNAILSQNLTSVGKGSKILLTKAPKLISEKFNNEYPGIKPQWYKEGDKYEAVYSDGTTKLNHSITFDKTGTIENKESELDYKEYPASINQYYSRRFPDEKYRIIQCEASTGEKYYYTKRKNEIIKFDTSGNYISKR